MYSNIPSVSRAIRDILFSNSIYMNSLKLGIANYTALAIKIKPEVEKIVGSQININTIVVSIKRIADTIQQQQQSEQELKIAQDEKEMITGARISLTGSILDVEFDKEMENIEKIFDLFDRESDIRFNIFQSKNHIKLFIENISDIKKILSNDPQKVMGLSSIKEGVSMITISLPWKGNEFRKTYQLLSMISNILYNNEILLHNAFFTPNEIVLIISDIDAAKVYELLRVKFYK
jgi:hypothetical protein